MMAEVLHISASSKYYSTTFEIKMIEKGGGLGVALHFLLSPANVFAVNVNSTIVLLEYVQIMRNKLF